MIEGRGTFVCKGLGEGYVRVGEGSGDKDVSAQDLSIVRAPQRLALIPHDCWSILCEIVQSF